MADTTATFAGIHTMNPSIVATEVTDALRDDSAERVDHSRYATLEDYVPARHDASTLAAVCDRPSSDCRWPSPCVMLSGPPSSFQLQPGQCRKPGLVGGT